MALPTPQSKTLIQPGELQRITGNRFKQLLVAKNSPAVSEAELVYNYLTSKTVDASFALAQFRVESQYGTAGYAKTTGSWGNMLYDKNLTILASGTYKPGNGYTYATYANYMDAIADYCRYIFWYIDIYGLDTIYGATARWIGKIPGSSGHTNYVTTIINDMIEYEFPSGGYVSGDEMIYAGDAINRATGKLLQKYPVNTSTRMYRGTGEEFYLKTFSGKPGNAWWLGFVNGGTEWGVIDIGILTEDPKGTLVYIKNPSKSKIINV